MVICVATTSGVYWIQIYKDELVLKTEVVKLAMALSSAEINLNQGSRKSSTKELL